MLVYLAMAGVGAGTEDPGMVAKGISGLIMTLTGKLLNFSPSNADIMLKLEQIDAKLDSINDLINDNQRQLMNEIIRT